MAQKKTSSATQNLSGIEPVPTMLDGYFSGDRPNPSLRTFFITHVSPYDADYDEYSPPPFTSAIQTKRSTAITNMHTYWSKKPVDAIRQYIRHYTSPGTLVLDPFSGSGSTALAALLEGRSAIAVDRSPAATFITANYCRYISPAQLQAAADRVVGRVEQEMDWLYATHCDRCGGIARTHYTVYSQVFQCPRCLDKFPLHECVKAEGKTLKGKPKSINACPFCFKKGHTEEIRSQSEKFGFTPVMVSYTCLNTCKPSRGQRERSDADATKRRFFRDHDEAKLAEIDDSEIPRWFPQGFSMTGFSRYQRDALFYYGIEEVADLYTKRNLWAMAALLDEIKKEPEPFASALLFCLTSIALKASRMMAHNNDGIGRIQKGTYYIPQIEHDINVLDFFEEAVGDMKAGYREIGDVSSDVLVSTENACTLDVPENSVDYIFTDPAYAGAVQYGELNYVWEAWLGYDVGWHDEEIVVNHTRGKTEAEWAEMLKRVMDVCYHALKPGRCISVCFHGHEGSWSLLQDVMTAAGFVPEGVEEALYIESKTKTVNQYFADKVTKRDLVLNFRKPKPGDWIVTHLFIPAGVDTATFQEMGRQIVREFLIAHPGATKDRIYDELVSRMVRRGEMEAHDFDALLKSVAEEVQEPVRENLFENKRPDLFGSHVVSRWYLKETADQIDQGEQDKEDAATERLEKFMLKYLEKNPEEEGVHYSDLFEQVITIPAKDRPRRLFENWLPEYFFKMPDGTWRPPEDEKERQQKAALREAGTLRRMKRFANSLLQGVPVRDQDRPGNDRTLAEWIRQCRRAGLYEQGRVLYEKGGLNLENLDDEEQIEVEDDYRLCVKRGSDDDGKAKGRKKKPDA